MQALLKLVEGTIVTVPAGRKGSAKCDATVGIDTSNILFIVGGAFAGMDTIVRTRLQTAGIGFEQPLAHGGAAGRGAVDGEALRRVDTGDLITFGLIPEFVGRFPCIAPLAQLTRAVRSPCLCLCVSVCVTTETRHLDRLGQLGEFEQDSDTPLSVSVCIRARRRVQPWRGQHGRPDHVWPHA